MPNAYVVLLIANLVYATGYTVTRVVLADVGPATLALARLVLGALVLVPLARVLHPGAGPVSTRIAGASSGWVCSGSRGRSRSATGGSPVPRRAMPHCSSRWSPRR